MEALHTLIEIQYHTPGLYEDILKRLGELELNISNVSREDLAGVDELHVRGAEVSLELASEIMLDDLRVLDVGCGIGGPSRMLADEFNCQVTGVDLSHEYIRTAKGLSELVGLQDKTDFIQSNALELPFENGSFDVVWTQHVQMNIHHKLKFYSEIERVLTEQGTFIYYDIFRTESGKVNYPVPWADDASMSFLGTTSNMDDILERLCFKNILTTDQSYKGITFLQDLFEKLKMNGPPTLGLNVLMGASTREKLVNILLGLEEEQIVLQSGIYKKRAIN
ncbi:MAG: methyltransferase domain-containing protein [Bacteroidales bacterium]|nr:methyltransferase domain-containing protein [Bacteroidales bacterium]